MPQKVFGRWVCLLAGIVICVAVAGGVHAQTAGYTLDGFVLASGGQASGGVYTVRGVAGQSTAGSLNGGAYSLTGGFVQAQTPSQLFLPVTIR